MVDSQPTSGTLGERKRCIPDEMAHTHTQFTYWHVFGRGEKTGEPKGNPRGHGGVMNRNSTQTVTQAQDEVQDPRPMRHYTTLHTSQLRHHITIRSSTLLNPYEALLAVILVNIRVHGSFMKYCQITKEVSTHHVN